MSKKKENKPDTEMEESFNKEEWFASMEKWAEEHMGHTTQLVWTNPKKVLVYAIDSTLTKYVTDVRVAQYLSDFQKKAIKGFRDSVLTLVDYYKNHPHGEELPKMIEDCAQKLKQIFITSTADLENTDKYIAEGEFRPTLLLTTAFAEIKEWVFMDSDQDVQKNLDNLVMDPNNVVGFYEKKIEQLAEMSYGNAGVYLAEPTIEDMTHKGEETLDYYLDRPEIDDSQKLKLQQTLNFKLPLSDVKKLYKNLGAYKTRFNNIFKKAIKDEVEMTNEDLEATKQYLEEHLWYAAKIFSEAEEMDPIEGWLQAEAITEGVYVALVKALGSEKFREYCNSNIEFGTNIKETLFKQCIFLAST